jgi:hypothetical protein
VVAKGDLVFEPNETFSIDLTLPPSQAGLLADGHAVGTIRNDDPQPTISIGDLSGPEGDSGTPASSSP